MTRPFKHIVLTLLALAVTVVNITHAHARNAGVVKNVYRQIEESHTQLQSVKTQLESFHVRSEYCERRPYLDTKEAAFEALKQIYDTANAPKNSYRGRRTSLKNLVLAKNHGGALDEVSPGGTQAMQDGTFFNKYDDLIEQIDIVYGEKRQAIREAATKKCGNTPGNQPTTTPAVSIPDPLTGVETELTFGDVTYPTSFPEKFCHQDEKDQLLYALREARFKAYQNSVKAGNLATTLRHKLGDLLTARDRAFRDADAAAKSGDRQTMNTKKTEYQSLKAQVDAAEAKFPSLIEKAKADEKRWRDVVDAIDAEIEKVNAIPVVDCTPADLTPAMTLGESQFSGMPEGVESLDLRPVEIPSVPEKVCTDAAKREFENRAYTAMSNSWDNRDQWKKRLADLNDAIDKAGEDASATLFPARNEARTESAKWVRIVQDATAAFDKANALQVEDCNGLTEPGKMATAFPGVHVDVPEADTRAYDLPEVPDYVCSWEEKQALIKRAEEARKTARHNHSQWGARATALGKLLYGDNAVSGDRTDLLSAHAEAQAQADYWAEQMLNVAHGVYWKLQDVDIRDCSKPEKKVSMGALNDAINNRPVFNGGQGAGARLDPFGSTCGADITCRGSALGGDLFGGQLYRTPIGHGGFDGSEAERALEHTLDGVEPRHQHGPDCDHSGHNSLERKEDRKAYSTPQAPQNPTRDSTDNSTGGDYPQSETPKSETRPDGARFSGDAADERDLPNENLGGPIVKDKLWFPPVRNSNTRTGQELETPQIEYRNGAENTTVRKMPGQSKYPDIIMRRPTPEQYEAIGSLPLEGPRFDRNAGSAPSTQKAKPSYQGQNDGEWVQVKPPVLVVPGGAADRPTVDAKQRTAGGT